MTEQFKPKGILKGHSGWITQIATTQANPDMILSASRGIARDSNSLCTADVKSWISLVLILIRQVNYRMATHQGRRKLWRSQEIVEGPQQLCIWRRNIARCPVRTIRVLGRYPTAVGPQLVCYNCRFIVLFSDSVYSLSGNTTRRFVGHTKDVLSVAFSADNRQIVSASRDKTIKLWNTLGQCKYTITVRRQCLCVYLMHVLFAGRLSHWVGLLCAIFS